MISPIFTKRSLWWIYGLAAVVIIFIAVLAIEHSSIEDEAIFCATLVVVVLALMTWSLNIRELDRGRAENISNALAPDKRAVEQARDLFLTSEYFKRKAQVNSWLSIAVLVLLGFFVGFAGFFLNNDTIKFASVEGLARQLDDGRFANSPTPAYAALQQQFAEASRLQAQAEASVADPIYRIASSFLIRISVVCVSIVLVVLLNKSFKYNNSMSALYRSRLMSLLRGGENIDEFIRYSDFYLPRGISYNTDFEHPADRMTAVFSKVADVTSSALSGSGRKTVVKETTVQTKSPDET